MRNVLTIYADQGFADFEHPTSDELKILVEDIHKKLKIKDVEIEVKFDEVSLSFKHWTYMFHRLASLNPFLTYDQFSHRVRFVNPNSENDLIIADIMYSEFNFNCKSGAKAVVYGCAGLVTLVLLVILALNLNTFMRQYFDVRAKFRYLANTYILKPDMKTMQKRYLDLGTSFDREIDDLSWSVVSVNQKYKFELNLMVSLIFAESYGWKFAVSKVGALGWMQIYPPAWEDIFKISTNVTEPGFIFDSKYNLDCGFYVFSFFSKIYKNDMYQTVLHYNGGRFKDYDGQYTLVTTESLLYAQKIFNFKCALDKIGH